MQARGFRFFFTPLFGVLFTFPSRYLSTIGLTVVLSLGGWCRQIRTGFLRPRPTQDAATVCHRFRVRGSHALRPAFPGPFPYRSPPDVAVLQPRARLDARGLGSSAFARRYSRNHCCLPFLRVLRCFSSPRSPHLSGSAPPGHWVPPFGNRRIYGHLRLPAAYRSLSRPSSPPRA